MSELQFNSEPKIVNDVLLFNKRIVKAILPKWACNSASCSFNSVHGFVFNACFLVNGRRSLPPNTTVLIACAATRAAQVLRTSCLIPPPPLRAAQCRMQCLFSTNQQAHQNFRPLPPLRHRRPLQLAIPRPFVPAASVRALQSALALQTTTDHQRCFGTVGHLLTASCTACRGTHCPSASRH
jgi:hypothetical protein